MLKKTEPSVFICRHCETAFAELSANTITRSVEFNFDSNDPDAHTRPRFVTAKVNVTYHKCPVCHEYSLDISSESSDITPFAFSQPPEGAKHVPSYIPQQIRGDYYEACSIIDLSPKASATLSRRCLQGMIRDFWKIHKKTLYEEISALEGLVPADQWNVLHSLRRLGNIGAHMEKDVNHIVDIDPGEATKLVRLIELLFKDWYVQRHEREALLQEITAIDTDKQTQRVGQ